MTLTFDLQFLSGLVSIIRAEQILVGDNAVVIAMVVQFPPLQQRMMGIVFGPGRLCSSGWFDFILQYTDVRYRSGALRGNAPATS